MQRHHNLRVRSVPLLEEEICSHNELHTQHEEERFLNVRNDRHVHARTLGRSARLEVFQGDIHISAKSIQNCCCRVLRSKLQTAARVRGSRDSRFPERASEEAHRVRERRETTREERARGMAR